MLDDGVRTVDDKFSLTPQELKTMITAIREAQAALGSLIKKPTQAEVKEKLLAGRSLWVVEGIRRGEKFSLSNLKSLRPGIGLSPMLIDQVLGKRSKKNIAKNSPLKRSYY